MPYNTSVECLTRELVIFSNRRKHWTVSVYTVKMKLPLLGLLLGLGCLLQVEVLVGGVVENCVRPGDIRTPALELPAALFMVQCHLRCVGKHLNETTALQLALGNDIQWPHLTTGDISRYRDCDTLSKMMECRRGCFIRSQDLTLSRIQCRDQCVSECEDECPRQTKCDSYSGSSCPMSCTRSGCGSGCVLAGNLLSGEGDVPLVPQHTLEVSWIEASHRPLAGGLYNISRPPSPVGGAGRTPGKSLTAFIARVQASGVHYYFPMTDPSEVLDLGQFSCQTVNVSLSAANKHTMSDFSPPVELTVYGENQMPSQLPSAAIDYEWTEYSTPGLAVVNITWDPPQWPQFITSYDMIIFSQSEECGGLQRMFNFMNIGRWATYFVWMPMRDYQMPVIGCVYQAVIRAMPCPEDSCQTGQQIMQINANTMKENYQPTMELVCHKYVDTSTGVISVFLQWEVQNVSQVVEAIGEYQIMPKLMDIRSDIPRHVAAVQEISIDANGSRMAYVVGGLLPDPNEHHQIFIRVTPKVKRTLSWRQVPAYKECPIRIQPRSPSAPGASVVEFSVDTVSVSLNISLTPPVSPYGDIVVYQVVVLREPPLAGEDPLTLNLLKETELQVKSGERYGALVTDNVNSEYRHIDETIHCLYLQIRAKNEFLWSKWSEPVLIERYPKFYSNCSALFEEPGSEVDLYAYVVGSLALVALAVMVLLAMLGISHFCRRYRFRKQIRRALLTSNPMFTICEPGKQRGSSLWEAPKADDWELPSSSILLMDEQPLGEGCFGTVHRGVVKGPIIHSRTMKNTICMNIAVKFLKKTATGSERSDFFTEIEMMKQVAEGNNPHVVNMIGCVTLQEPICLVTEFVKFGDLLSYLTTIRRLLSGQSEVLAVEMSETDSSHPSSSLPSNQSLPLTIDNNNAAAIDNLCPLGENCANGASREDCDAGDGACGEGDPSTEPLSPLSQCASYDKLNPYANPGELEPISIVSFAYQIASGMEYLSSLGIVHRDLACRNILVGEGKQIKISDFGMARTTVDEVYVKSTKGRLPWKWMAIESIESREYTTASDVWSYGVALWEIATLGGFPYPTIANGDLLEYLRKGNRLECPSECSREIYDIMQKCWEDTPEKRPTFSSLKTMFEAMLQENSPYIELHNTCAYTTHYSASSHLLKQPLAERISEEGSSLSSTSTSSSSSLSTALDSSNYQLLKSSPVAIEVDPPLLEDQQSAMVPPNLYVDTPTKPSQRKRTLEQGNGDHPVRPTHLSLQLDTAETEV